MSRTPKEPENASVVGATGVADYASTDEGNSSAIPQEGGNIETVEGVAAEIVPLQPKKHKKTNSKAGHSVKRTVGFAILRLLEAMASFKSRVTLKFTSFSELCSHKWKKLKRIEERATDSGDLTPMEADLAIEAPAVKSGRLPETAFQRSFRYLGLRIFRRLRYVKRRMYSVKLAAAAVMQKLWAMFVRSYKLFAVRNGIDLYARQEAMGLTVQNISKASGEGFAALSKHLFKLAAGGAWRFIRWICGSANYIAPILASACFAVVVMVTLNMTFALEVRYNGEPIGYIADESVFNDAEKEVLKRIVFEDYIRPDDTIPEFAITAIKSEKLSDEYEITNEIIKASGNELAEASGLYIDDKFMGAVTEGKKLDTLLASIKNTYRSDDENESVEFVKTVNTVDGLFPLTSIVDVGLLESEINTEESQQRVYRAVAGDAPITIAQKNGIPYSQLKALNPEIEKSLLIGQEIMVEKAVPMLEVKVIRTETIEEDEQFKVEQIQDSSKYQGYVQVAQSGEKGLREVVSKVTYVDGIETGREILSTVLIKDPINEKIVVGGKRPLEQIPKGAQTTSETFRWPTDGGSVTCAYGSAGYWGHTGLDIGNMPMGSAVRASASGTVIKVQYDTWNYGYHIMIDHGGDVQTLYGHNSKLYVKVGDWVEQGQLIAAMGRTGRATGVHVHFEIRLGGRYVNPTEYIGNRSPY